MRLLITGVTGFLGTHLARELLKENTIELLGTYRNPKKTPWFEEQGIEMRQADLLNPKSLKDITKDVDVVVHLAALMRFHDPWNRLYAHNVNATQIIAQDALDHGVQHFIYSSSTEATGPVASIPGDETSPAQPSYDYGKTKYITELWLEEKHRTQHLPLTILRPTGIYGPGDVYVTLSTVRAVANKKLRFLPGKGNNTIHFTYVDDVTQGIRKTIEKTTQAIGETFILASDEYLTYKDMFSTIAHLLNVPRPGRSIPMSLAKIYLSYIQWNNARKGIDDFAMHTSLIDTMKTNRAYSNAKAKKILGFSPKYSFEEGMKKTIDWYKEKNLL
ncbi:MAG: NAD(P)-dependent oxidoreductase [Candidatus Thermoplasmatota archaeon]|nr:NAD(P)-dependent oxidoreductase [Candidatus Thermoplasmatota archaeon]